ncbi:unnamed protein product, partial [Pylaiella littoralis]
MYSTVFRRVEHFLLPDVSRRREDLLTSRDGRSRLITLSLSPRPVPTSLVRLAAVLCHPKNKARTLYFDAAGENTRSSTNTAVQLCVLLYDMEVTETSFFPSRMTPHN